MASAHDPGPWLLLLSLAVLIQTAAFPILPLGRDGLMSLTLATSVCPPLALGVIVAFSWFLHALGSRPRRWARVSLAAALAGGWVLVLGGRLAALGSMDSELDAWARVEVVRRYVAGYSSVELPGVACPEVRYEPTGAEAAQTGVSTWSCPPGTCVFDCWDLDVCTRQGVTCEPCDEVEAFRAGPCAGCVEPFWSRPTDRLVCTWGRR